MESNIIIYGDLKTEYILYLFLYFYKGETKDIPLKNVAMFLMKKPINLSIFLPVPGLILSTFI